VGKDKKDKKDKKNKKNKKNKKAKHEQVPVAVPSGSIWATADLSRSDHEAVPKSDPAPAPIDPVEIESDEIESDETGSDETGSIEIQAYEGESVDVDPAAPGSADDEPSSVPGH